MNISKSSITYARSEYGVASQSPASAFIHGLQNHGTDNGIHLASVGPSGMAPTGETDRTYNFPNDIAATGMEPYK